VVASVQNRSRHFSLTIRANIRIAEFDFEKQFFFKSPNRSTSTNFKTIGFDFECLKFMRIFVTIITVAFFAHWTCSMISMHWCCYMGGNVGE